MKKIETIHLRKSKKKIFQTELLGRGLMNLLILAVFSSCSQSSPANEGKQDNASKTVKNVQIKYAKGFSIEYHEGYEVINILNHFEDNEDTLKYYLVPKGKDVPDKLKNEQVIFTPVQKLVGMSSMHVALAEFVDATDILVGLGDLKYVNSASALKMIESGKIKEVGLGGNMNDEIIININPDLVMIMGSPDAKLARHHTLKQIGIPVMVNAEWLEDHPLGRTEWVKVMAALIDKEELADKRFCEVEKEYLRLVALTKNITKKPAVIIGMNFKNVWHVPDGDSYLAQLLKDAGASYKWFGVNGKGTLPLDFEAVYNEGLIADYWLNLGYVDTKREILDMDVRYSDLKAFKEGNIYNNNKKVNSVGSNDYWESGAVHPDLVLSDMISILHPELLPTHQLSYYKKIH